MGKGLMAVGPEGPSTEHQQIGRVTQIDQASMTFGCHWRTGDWTYQANAKTTFRMGETAAGFADLKPGATVQVLFHFVGKTEVADAVMISS